MINRKKDFPILQRKIHGKPLVYLDSAATSQKPRPVIRAIVDYYEQHNSNVHRAVHQLSGEASELYDSAHETAAQFIGAQNYEEIVFTKNTTEGLNLVANHFSSILQPGDEVLLSEMEHHSNLVPWQIAAKKTGAQLRFIRTTPDGSIDMESFSKELSNRTKVVALTHISNTLGTITPVKEITAEAHKKGAIVAVDGAQSVPHLPISVKKLDVDYLAFSAHKMCGPTGIGVLYGKRELLEKTTPLLYGGDMIKEVTYQSATWNDLPWKFEAGTPNIAGAAGFKAALEYLQKIGMGEIADHDKELTTYALKRLHEEKVTLFGPKTRGAVVSFAVDDVHPHDISTILDSEGIAIRGGHHCTMPLMKKLNLSGTARARFYLYNTKRDVDTLIRGIQKVRGIMHGRS